MSVVLEVVFEGGVAKAIAAVTHVACVDMFKTSRPVEPGSFATEPGAYAPDVGVAVRLERRGGVAGPGRPNLVVLRR